MNIVLLGIQGCGKGTLVAGLEQHFDISLVSMGQILRDEIATGSELGKKIKEIIDKGMLVDNQIVMDTLNKMLKANTKAIRIFDGFPRNKNQAEELDKIATIDLVIHLNLSRDIAIKRVVNRLICSDCAAITTKQQSANGICPQCGGKLIQRSDDTIEAANKRFDTYEKETYPLLKIYKARGVVADIDANRTPDEVLEDVLRVINEYKN